MAFPGTFSSTVISDVITTCIQNRSGTIADNVTDNNPLLQRLKTRGKIKTVSGGDTILNKTHSDNSFARIWRTAVFAGI